jgi:hypothetical protein
MLMSSVSKWFSKLAYKVMDSREPDFVIGPTDDPYMLRWWAIPRNRLLNIYVHKILHDDDDRALHDHPWASLSLMVQGGVFEQFTDGQLNDFGELIPYRRWISTRQWVYRPAHFAHRLELANYFKPVPAVTIFITGPRIREWGFHCAKGWRHWKDFVSDESKGQVGRGCGEMDEPSQYTPKPPINWAAFNFWIPGAVFLLFFWGGIAKYYFSVWFPL